MISIEGRECEDGEVEIAVFIESVNGVCGVLLELNYDDEEFLLLSVGAEACELDLSYRDESGKIKILLDGVENSDAECELVRLYFKRRTGSLAAAEFVLGEAVEVFSLNGGELLREEISVGERGFFVGTEDAVECCDVELISLSARVCESGEVELGFAFEATGEAFALGAEIFLIDFGGDGQCGKLWISSVVASGNGCEVWCRVGAMRSFCAVISPVGYVGRRCVGGEKRAVVVNVRGGEVHVEIS